MLCYGPEVSGSCPTAGQVGREVQEKQGREMVEQGAVAEDSAGAGIRGMCFPARVGVGSSRSVFSAETSLLSRYPGIPFTS